MLIQMYFHDMCHVLGTWLIHTCKLAFNILALYFKLFACYKF